MIFGVGTDLVEFSRIERAFERFGERFVGHLLMDQELELFRKTRRPTRFLAMRFAAKEALVKAMGTGFAHGVWIRDTGFVPDPRGRPTVIFSARGRNVCRQLGAGAAHVSLTDESGMIAAFAVIEKALDPR
ncbi:MAG: holo-ACP synthase [Pseudomonadota bacterium]